MPSPDVATITIHVLCFQTGSVVRTGHLGNGGRAIKLQKWQQITLTSDPTVLGDKDRVAILYPELASVVTLGDVILIDHGAISLDVTQVNVDAGTIVCAVNDACILKGSRRVHLPGLRVDHAVLTDQEKADIAFGVAHGVDFIATSFPDVAAVLVHFHSFFSYIIPQNIVVCIKKKHKPCLLINYVPTGLTLFAVFIFFTSRLRSAGACYLG